MTEDNDQRVVKLIASDGIILEISRKATYLSNTLNQMLNESNFDNNRGSVSPLRVTNVSSTWLKKVIIYCEHHKNDPISEEEPNGDVSSWDVQFMNVDKQSHYEIMMAAYHLRIEPLKTLSAQSFANLLKNKTTEEMRQFLGIENDFSPEEEEAIQRENAWVLDFEE